MKKPILIIEDSQDISELLAFALQKEGYSTQQSTSAEQGFAMASSLCPALILLDIMLPGKDGYTVCKELASQEHTRAIPIIILTARGDEADRIKGFELGAVDYVVKPFSIRELMLRVRAVLARQSPMPEPKKDYLECGGLRLLPQTHTVTIEAVPLHLTVTEFAILHDLLLHQGIVRTREQILQSAWGQSFDGYERTVDAHIKRLRAKLGKASGLLETVRGLGYRIQQG